MKLRINKTYTLLLLVALCGIFSACSHEDPTLFEKESDGFYFGYDSKESLTSTINFADSILTEAKQGYVPIKIKLLGHLSDQATTIKLKAEPVEGYKEAKVTLPDVVVKAGEYETIANVVVECPDQADTTYAVKISFEQGDKSMKDFDGFTIYAKESYERPSNWNDSYYGTWTVDKYKFICKTLGKTGFCDDDSYTQTNMYNPTLIYAVREWHKAHPGEAIAYDIPFLDGTLFYDAYDQPEYWGDLQDKYFGGYDGYGFGTLASSLGVTTQNEEQVFGSTDEALLRESNKGAVRLMLENYNNKFEQGYSYWGLNSAFSVPMIDDIDYDVVAPAFWTNSLTQPLVEKYYGAYSEQKYKKMLKIASREMGSGFKPFLMFPVKLQWDDASMENLPMWDTDANIDWMYFGEEVIYQFYKMFKQEEPSLFPDNAAKPAVNAQAKAKALAKAKAMSTRGK